MTLNESPADVSRQSAFAEKIRRYGADVLEKHRECVYDYRITISGKDYLGEYKFKPDPYGMWSSIMLEAAKMISVETEAQNEGVEALIFVEWGCGHARWFRLNSIELLEFPKRWVTRKPDPTRTGHDRDLMLDLPLTYGKVFTLRVT